MSFTVPLIRLIDVVHLAESTPPVMAVNTHRVMA
jgi:hypothetical protein